jgi:hypothetical protein
VALACLAPFVAGCGENLPDLPGLSSEEDEKPQPEPLPARGPVADLAGESQGTIDFVAGGTWRCTSCFAELIVLDGGRPSVLQIRSYRGAASETFPSVFVRAETTAHSLAELAEAPLSAKVYVQTAADGAILYTPDGRTVELNVTAANAESVAATVESAALANAAGGENVSFTANFQAVVLP